MKQNFEVNEPSNRIKSLKIAIYTFNSSSTYYAKWIENVFDIKLYQYLHVKWPLYMTLLHATHVELNQNVLTWASKKRYLLLINFSFFQGIWINFALFMLWSTYRRLANSSEMLFIQYKPGLKSVRFPIEREFHDLWYLSHSRLLYTRCWCSTPPPPLKKQQQKNNNNNKIWRWIRLGQRKNWLQDPSLYFLTAVHIEPLSYELLNIELVLDILVHTTFASRLYQTWARSYLVRARGLHLARAFYFIILSPYFVCMSKKDYSHLPTKLFQSVFSDGLE